MLILATCEVMLGIAAVCMEDRAESVHKPRPISTCKLFTFGTCVSICFILNPTSPKPSAHFHFPSIHLTPLCGLFLYIYPHPPPPPPPASYPPPLHLSGQRGGQDSVALTFGVSCICSFASTENYIILILWPCHYSPLKMLVNRALYSEMQWRGENSVQFFVVDKQQGGRGHVATYK